MRRSVWERFWFDPQETSPLALVRIGLALVSLVWALSLVPSAADFFGPDGIVGKEHDGWLGGLLAGATFEQAGLLVLMVLAVASVSLAFGYRTRLSSVVVFLGLLCLQQRNPWVFNTGDLLLRTIAFYVMLSPAGTALSVDRWRKRPEHFWEPPRRPLWALRLLQVQLSFIYLGGVWAKLQGSTWNDGTAVGYALRIEDLARFQAPGFLSESLLMANVMTYGTLAVEVGVAILIWNTRARPWALVVGVLLHMVIELSFRVGFFSLSMFVLYVAFLPPDAVAAFLARVRIRMSSSRLRWVSRVANARPPQGSILPGNVGEPAALSPGN